MSKIFLALTLSLLLFAPTLVAQENEIHDVFVPISKYIERGSVESLSTWFADNLEMNIQGNSTSSSKNHAKQILKSFFLNYNPKSFQIVHRSNSYPMQYAIGRLDAGGESFRVTIFVKISKQGNSIQQFKVEKE